MSIGKLQRQQVSNNIAAIIDGYANAVYNDYEKEDAFNLSIPILQKKLKKLSEQIIYFHAENRLLYNYIMWYEKKIGVRQNQEKRHSSNISLSSEIKHIPHQILKQKLKQPLSIQRKREIAEAIFKVLLAYSKKYTTDLTQYIDDCINKIETDEETITYLKQDLITLTKFIQKIDENLRHLQKIFTAEEFFTFVNDRIRYREALNERKRQKTVRLHFHIDTIETSLRKIHHAADNVTEIDFEQLKIDIDKQLKELTMKNKMLVFYKQQRSEVNVKLNEKKPELFKALHELASIRNTINRTIQKLTRYNETKLKMETEINKYETINGPLRDMIRSYRVPSISSYLDLKSQQVNLHRQIQTWQRRVQIAERELHLRQIEVKQYPEKVIHPWKYLQNPSSILFYKHYQISNNRIDEQNHNHDTTVNNPLNVSLPKANSRTSITKHI